MNDWVCLLHPAVLPKRCKTFVRSIPYAQLQSGSHSTFLSHGHHDSPFPWTLVRASIHPEQQPSLGISPLSMAVRVDRGESNTHVWFPFPAGLHWLCGQILRTLLSGTRSMTSSFSTLQKTHFRPPPPVERMTWEKKNELAHVQNWDQTANNISRKNISLNTLSFVLCLYFHCRDQFPIVFAHKWMHFDGMCPKSLLISSLC